jgi:hypothetical protein
MPDSLPALEQQRSSLAQKVVELGDLRPGSITGTGGGCGNPACHGHQPNDPGHSPHLRLTRLLPDKLNDLQHRHFAAIMSGVHVHLDHDNCLEVILVRGKSSLVQNLANSLIATKGLKHGRFTLTASGRDLP